MFGLSFPAFGTLIGSFMNASTKRSGRKFLRTKTMVVLVVTFLALLLLPVSGPLYVEAAPPPKTPPTCMKGPTMTWTLDPGVNVWLHESACGSVRGSIGFKVTTHNYTAWAHPNVTLDFADYYFQARISKSRPTGQVYLDDFKVIMSQSNFFDSVNNVYKNVESYGPFSDNKAPTCVVTNNNHPVLESFKVIYQGTIIALDPELVFDEDEFLGAECAI
jgi:hypothetical protein